MSFLPQSPPQVQDDCPRYGLQGQHAGIEGVVAQEERGQESKADKPNETGKASPKAVVHRLVNTSCGGDYRKAFDLLFFEYPEGRKWIMEKAAEWISALAVAVPAPVVTEARPHKMPDEFYTPASAVRLLVPYLPKGARIWEPCWGEGHLSWQLFNGMVLLEALAEGFDVCRIGGLG